MRSQYSGAGSDAPQELLAGSRLLREAFLRQAYRTIKRSAAVFDPGDPDPGVILIQRGVALRHCTLPDGRRVILDVLLPGDIVGLDHPALGPSYQDLTAADALGYRWMRPSTLRSLLADPGIPIAIMALMGSNRRRLDRHLAAICCLSARHRVTVFLLDFHDRLMARGLIDKAEFHLPMTQEQIAHHLGITTIHANRMLREMRDDNLLSIDRQKITLLDLDRLREAVTGLPPMVDVPSLGDRP